MPPYIYTELSDRIKVEVCIDGFLKSYSVSDSDEIKDKELEFAKLLYTLLSEFTSVSQPWGLLTGVRPVKLFRSLAGESGYRQAKNRFSNDFFVSDEKLKLLCETEKNESRIIELSKPDSFSLYVGIPFCPSRCSYCSFVMSSIERAGALMQPYTERLREELLYTAQLADRLKLRLESVYFGGGTPTSLSAEQLDLLLSTVKSSFDMSTCREFTVEAGRPDTLTEEKLRALKENGVDRISINPQTTNDGVLEAIGRKHTAQRFFSAFELARSCGFDNINADLIAGLPSDTPQGFEKSLEDILGLNAECVTVHTLCMKRASQLTTNGALLNKRDGEYVRRMLNYAAQRLGECRYIPYYLYRQSRMVGNFENVGWSKRGFESLYNVFVMDETHTVLACGSGGVTKLKQPRGSRLERVFNFKYPYEYIDRFDSILDRKEKIIDFYHQYPVE